MSADELEPADEQYFQIEQPSGYIGVTDDALAVWALGKRAKLETEVKRIRENTQRYIDEIQADATAAESTLLSKMAWFDAELRGYYEGLHNPPGTYKLPNGTIKRNAPRKSTKVVEPAEFVRWALDNAPDTLKYEPRVSEMKTWARTEDGSILSPDGERVPGVQVVAGEPTFTITSKAAPEFGEAPTDTDPF